ncbi:hypothetical protein LMIY3S_04054 [Labrys miyagiensis]
MSASAKGTVLITGASSGIGAVYADRLAHRGYDLILVARSEDKLKLLAERIEKTTGRQVRILAADLNAREGLARIEGVLKTDKSITGLVNNAGFGSAAPLLEASVDKMEEMIGLNVTALTRLTYAAVPSLVERGGGTIINIASIVAIAPELLNGVYGGSKAYVLAFSQSLNSRAGRQEHPRPGGAARRYRHRLLERPRRAGRAVAGEHRGHGGGGHGRCLAGGPPARRTGDHPGAARDRGLECLRSRPQGADAEPLPQQAGKPLLHGAGKRRVGSLEARALRPAPSKPKRKKEGRPQGRPSTISS